MGVDAVKIFFELCPKDIVLDISLMLIVWYPVSELFSIIALLLLVRRRLGMDNVDTGVVKVKSLP